MTKLLIFSIQFGERRDYSDAWKKALIDKVRKHELDANSLEVKSKCHFVECLCTACLVKGSAAFTYSISGSRESSRKGIAVRQP